MPATIPANHARVLRAHYPDLTAEQIEAHDDGNDHAVYVVRTEQRPVTFRFPRAPRRINPTRKRFLDAFAPRSPIAVPLITIHHDAQTGSDYEINAYLPGVAFTPALARSFTAQARRRVAGELGAWLTALHRFPLGEARALAVDELDPATFGEYMKQNLRAYPYFRQMTFPILTPAERRWVARLFGGYVALVKARPSPVCVTHADMWDYHILVDPQRASLTGVLDYWPRIADPAQDFKAFESYGADFCAAVSRAYAVPRDDDFERRRLFYTGHDAVFELARAIERRDPAQIDTRRQSLAAYIAEHPPAG